MPLVQRFFIFFKWLKGSIPLVQRLFFFFYLIFPFFGKDLEILNFFYYLFFKYIHEQSTLNATWIFRIQRNIETWNKQTNFKLNHDVATKCGVRQSWATCLFLVHLGCLRLGVLEPSLWWNGLDLHLEGLNHMINWYLLEMTWPYTWKACIMWTFGLWCWSCVYTFDGLKYWS